tara:strand:+ start:407 stop:604 length:198 start_codon:yes stop_codon:yes gene_type:complete
MRLTKKEKDAVGLVVEEGIGRSYRHLLGVMNCDGWQKPDGSWEDYTEEELERITTWVWNKLGLGA